MSPLAVVDTPPNLMPQWASWNRSDAANQSGIMRFYYDITSVPGTPGGTYYYESRVGNQTVNIWRELRTAGFTQPVRVVRPVEVLMLVDPDTLAPTAFARSDGSAIVSLHPANG